jgi:putative ABC transport system permease protein
MNIFHKVTLQSMKKNRAQTIVTVIGVILSAAMITAVATLAISLQAYMIKGAAAKYGEWHIEMPDIDSAFMLNQQRDSRVKETVSLQNIGYSPLEGGQNPEKPYLFITGWSEKAFHTLPLKLLSGRFPQNSGEIILPAHLASNGGVKYTVGDTLTLSVGNRMNGTQKLSQHDPYNNQTESFVPAGVKTYTIVGICQRPGIEEFSAPGYTLITTEDTAASDSLTLFITLKNPYQVHAYAKSIADQSSYVLNDDVLRFMGLSSEKIITVLMYSIGAILILLVMLGSVFLIYNSFSISLNERTHQFGILMSVGATEKQIRNSVLFEGFCIGIIGIPLGILVGIPSIKLVLTLVARNFANALYDNVPLSLVLSVPSIIAAALISMITILISAYTPARKAARIPVMDCICQTNEVKVDVRSVQVSSMFRGLYGLEETLAIKNFKRNKRRYRSIILSLTLSVVLFVSASSFVDYLNQITENSAVVSENYDICFSTRDMDDTSMMQLYDQLKTADNVTKSSYQALSSYSCTLNTSELSSQFLDEFGKPIGYDGTSNTVDIQIDVQFVERSVYQHLLKSLDLSPDTFTGQNEDMIMAGILPDHWYTQEQPMQFTLSSKTEDQSKTINATFVKDYPDLLPSDPGEWPGYSLMLIAPYEAKPQFDALDTVIKPTKLGMTFQSDKAGQSTAQMQTMIDGAGITADYTLYNVYGILEQNRNMTFIVNLFAVVFIAMISLIAVANVFNTISTNIKLRRREFAMLRSVGMSDRDFNKMMRFECALYGMRTMLWGLPLTGILSASIYKGMKIGGGDIHFVFPWKSMSISIVSVLFIVFITMLYAISKIKKENIIDGIRDDMS